MLMRKRTELHVLTLITVMTAGTCIDSRSGAYATGREPPAIRVSVRDLDLTTYAGAAALYWRIRNAARSLCGQVDIVFPEEIAAWHRCVDESIGSAVAKVHSANLTDYYQAKTHRAHRATRAQTSKPADRIR
jgi:UrcA family protein